MLSVNEGVELLNNRTRTQEYSIYICQVVDLQPKYSIYNPESEIHFVPPQYPN